MKEMIKTLKTVWYRKTAHTIFQADGGGAGGGGVYAMPGILLTDAPLFRRRQCPLSAPSVHGPQMV